MTCCLRRASRPRAVDGPVAARTTSVDLGAEATTSHSTIPVLARAGRAGSWITCRRARHLAIAVDLGTGGCRRCRRCLFPIARWPRHDRRLRPRHARTWVEIGARRPIRPVTRAGGSSRPRRTPVISPVGHEHVPGSGADLEGTAGLARRAGGLAADRSDPASEVERWAIDGGELPAPRWVEEHLTRLPSVRLQTAPGSGVCRDPGEVSLGVGLARNDDPVAACSTAGGRRDQVRWLPCPLLARLGVPGPPAHRTSGRRGVIHGDCCAGFAGRCGEPTSRVGRGCAFGLHVTP